MLTSIHVSGCLDLSSLVVDLNFLPVLDLSENTNLGYLKCLSNSLTTLDLSLNSALYYVRCSANPLTSLNVKNENNIAITNFDARNNASLTCIQVDNEDLANAGTAPYNAWQKDAIATYSEDCASLGIDDDELAQSITLFPNPTSTFISVHSEIMLFEKIEIYSVLGKKVKSVQSNFKHITVTDLSKGVYFIKIMSQNRAVTKKLLKK